MEKSEEERNFRLFHLCSIAGCLTVGSITISLVGLAVLFSLFAATLPIGILFATLACLFMPQTVMVGVMGLLSLIFLLKRPPENPPQNTQTPEQREKVKIKESFTMISGFLFVVLLTCASLGFGSVLIFFPLTIVLGVILCVIGASFVPSAIWWTFAGAYSFYFIALHYKKVMMQSQQQFSGLNERLRRILQMKSLRQTEDQQPPVSGSNEMHISSNLSILTPPPPVILKDSNFLHDTIDSKNEPAEEYMCIVCYERPRDTIFQCGHKVCCSEVRIFIFFIPILQ